jgi:hypothetical protein
VPERGEFNPNFNWRTQFEFLRAADENSANADVSRYARSLMPSVVLFPAKLDGCSYLIPYECSACIPLRAQQLLVPPAPSALEEIPRRPCI